VTGDRILSRVRAQTVWADTLVSICRRPILSISEFS